MQLNEDNDEMITTGQDEGHTKKHQQQKEKQWEMTGDQKLLLQQKEISQSHEQKLQQLTINDKNIIMTSYDNQQQPPQQQNNDILDLQKHNQQPLQIAKQQQEKHHQEQESQQKNTDEVNNKIQYSKQPQTITHFHPQYKSSTITYNLSFQQAQQSKYYFENCKLTLTQPITSTDSTVTFRLDNLKYCIGLGVGLKEILQKHQYDYKSTTSNQLGHGLYLITTQGYSWSHSQTEEDDVFRGNQWKSLYTGSNIAIKLQGQSLTFKYKKQSFTLTLPSRILQKYTLCFCVYLHEKTDAVSIVS